MSTLERLKGLLHYKYRPFINLYIKIYYVLRDINNNNYQTYVCTSKETFIEASKVVDKPSKVIN